MAQNQRSELRNEHKDRESNISPAEIASKIAKFSQSENFETFAEI